MLLTYLKSKEAIDISLMLRQTIPDEQSSDTSQGYFSAVQAREAAEQPPCKRQRLSREALVRGQFDVLELDLDKSMASITATHSPLAVLRTIEWAKKSRFAQ